MFIFFTKVDPKLESSFRNFIYKSSLLIKVMSPIRRFELSSLKDIHSLRSCCDGVRFLRTSIDDFSNTIKTVRPDFSRPPVIKAIHKRIQGDLQIHITISQYVMDFQTCCHSCKHLTHCS